MSDANDKKKQKNLKFLVLIDKTEECEKAFRFVLFRCKAIGSRISLLSVVDSKQNINLFNLDQVIKDELIKENKKLQERYTLSIEDTLRFIPERYIKFSNHLKAINEVLEEDRDLNILVLASDSKGLSDPVIEIMINKKNPAIRIPILIVPGHLSFSEIEELAGQ